MSNGINIKWKPVYCVVYKKFQIDILNGTE